MKARRQALLVASHSMGLIEGLQGHDLFEKNLREKHEQFCEIDINSGEEGDGGGEGEVSATAAQVDCYVPSTPPLGSGSSVPASPFQGKFSPATAYY